MITRELVGKNRPAYALGEVAEFLDHMRRPVKEADRNPGPYPYFGANGQQGTIDDFIFDEPLILLAEDGGFFDAPERGIAYRISGKTWVNNHAHVIRPKNGKLDLPYLCRVLENYDVRPFISGTTRSKLTKGQAEKILIPLPPLNEQRRIAAILDKGDALRRKRKRALELLDNFASSLFSKIFGHRGMWLQSSKQVSLFDISNPKQWRTISSSDLQPTGYPVYGANGRIGYYNEYNHETETVLITCRGATCGTINICEPRSYVTGNSMALDDLDADRVNLDYLAMALRVRGVDDAITGTAQPQITRQSLSSVAIPLPPRAAQDKYSASCRVLAARKPVFERSASSLEALFSSLQHRAFSAQL